MRGKATPRPLPPGEGSRRASEGIRRQRAWASGALLLCAVLAAPLPAHSIELTYTVRVRPAATTLPVTVRIDGLSAELSLRLSDNYAGIEDYDTYFRNFQVAGASFQKEAQWLLRIGRPVGGSVTVSYDVWLGGQSQARGKTLPLIDRDHAFIPGASTFIYPLDPQSVTRTRVRFERPADWRVATSWGLDRTEFLLEGNDLDELIYSFAAIGDYRLHTGDFDGVPIHCAFRGRGLSTDEEVSGFLMNILHAHRATFGAVPFKRLLAIGDFSGLGGTVSGNAFHNSINLLMPKDRRLREHAAFRNLIAHESFHLWNGGDGVLAYGDYDVLWVSEGVTDYYAQKNLVRAGLIREVEMLEEMAGKYLRLRMSYLQNSPLTQAGRRYFDDSRARNLVYTKGALAAFLIDTYLGAVTDGEKSMDDVLRALAARRNNMLRAERYFQADVSGALGAVGGPDLSRLFNDFAVGDAARTFEDVVQMSGYRLDREELPGYTIGVFDVGPAAEPALVRALDRNGPAFTVGLQEGDRIVRFSGVAINSRGDLDREMMQMTAGDGRPVRLVVQRDGQELQFDVRPQRFYRYILKRTGAAEKQ